MLELVIEQRRRDLGGFEVVSTFGRTHTSVSPR